MPNVPDLRDSAPWKKRYHAETILWGRQAHNNPKRGLVCTNRDGIYQLYAWDIPANRLTRLTDQPAGVVRGKISSHGEWIYFLQDEGGNEIGHFVRVPFEGGPAQDLTPGLSPYSSFNINESRDGSTLGFTIPGPGGFSVYTMQDMGELTPLILLERASFGPLFSANSALALVSSTDHSKTLDTHLIVLETGTRQVLAELWDGEGTSISGAIFSPLDGDARIAASSNVTGYPRPFLWDPHSGDRRFLPLENIPGDVQPWDWSYDGRYILLNQIHHARSRLYRYDLENDTLKRLDHPEGVLGNWYGADYLPEGEILTTFQDPSTPSRLVTLDGASGEIRRVLLTGERVPSGRSWKSVTFESENGDAIQAWLALPEGDGPFPTILHTHGGPTTVQTAAFSPEAQAFLDHGFAFMSINFHGSTTFGREFEHSIRGNLGELEVRDMAAAYHWLVGNGFARPEAVFLTGASYGGYLTLLALGKRPELWAGGMGVVAIADWFLMYEDSADTLKGIQRAFFGGTPEETPEAHSKSSPITYAENYRAPLLVIQGSNDSRCPSRQMERFERKLKSFGKSIEVHWFDAGHGALSQAEQIEHTALKLKFAHRVLG